MKLFRSCFFAALLALGPAVSIARAGDDWEYWSYYGVTAKLPHKLQLGAEQRFRFRNDMSDFFYVQTNFGLWWNAHEHLTLGTFYSFIEEDKSGEWRDENRWTMEATVKASLGPLRFSDRNRFEQRWHEVGGTGQRYRNSLKMEWPIKVRGRKVSPYVYDEVFYDFEKDELSRNRLSTGVTVELTRQLSLEIFYILQSDRTGTDWNERNVVGSLLKASF